MARKLVITIDLENDAFRGSGISETRRVLASFIRFCVERRELLDKTLMDINGNSVGKAEIVEE